MYVSTYACIYPCMYVCMYVCMYKSYKIDVLVLALSGQPHHLIVCFRLG